MAIAQQPGGPSLDGERHLTMGYAPGRSESISTA